MWYFTPRSLCEHRNGMYLGRSLLLTVVKECTKQTAVEVVQQCDEEQLIELKGCWELQAEEDK